MFFVLAASAAVSLVTLTILLLNPNEPGLHRIPAAFLGGTRFDAPLRVRITPPPWLPWLLVLLATAGSVLAYCPARPEHPAALSGTNALVWVDDSLSSILASRSADARLEAQLEAALPLGLRLFLLEPDFAAGRAAFSFAAQRDLSDLKAKVSERLQGEPSPFARPLAVDALLEALKRAPEFSDGRGLLVVVSDGQVESLQNLNPLKAFFREARLVALPEPKLEPDARAEIVPQALLALWGETSADGADAGLVDEASSRIPTQARPGIVRESWTALAPPFARIGFETRPRMMPMFTGCSAQLPGPLELDTFADLRSLAGFFQVPFRMEACRDAKQRTLFAEDDPWRYRMPSVWVVQVDDAILNTLKEQGELWLPDGFVPDVDGLVYVAGHDLGEGDGARPLLQIPVQLDAGAVPQPVYLMPPPPEGPLVFPLPGGSAQSAPPALHAFRPIYRAGDDLPLGYRAGETKVFFLRTTVAMPNGELGRSSGWTRFWFDVAAAVASGRPHVRELQFTDASEFQEAMYAARPAAAADGLPEARDLSAFPLRLDPQTLRFAQGLPPPSSQTGLSLGFFASADKKNFLVVSAAAIEHSRNFLAPSEFSANWTASAESGRDAGADAQGIRSARAESRIVVGAALATLALLFLWLRRPRGGASRAAAFALGFAAAAVPLASARAQETSPLDALRRRLSRAVAPAETSGPRTIPFRVAWCDAEVPPDVSTRYKHLRDLLAGRGTIEMPQELVGGGCRPGAADLWWTDSPSGLDKRLSSEHISAGGAFVLEGAESVPEALARLAEPSIGLTWETPQKRGLLYRSFYLLSSFDGCVQDSTRVLSLRKKINAHSPVGITTAARMLTGGRDCFAGNDDLRARSFVNLMYSLLASDYKEDQLQLPEILNRVRNLGLEP